MSTIVFKAAIKNEGEQPLIFTDQCTALLWFEIFLAA
jgi:hypothetical protein